MKRKEEMKMMGLKPEEKSLSPGASLARAKDFIHQGVSFSKSKHSNNLKPLEVPPAAKMVLAKEQAKDKKEDLQAILTKWLIKKTH